MARKKQLPASTDLWVGWTHLVEPFDNLADPSAAEVPMLLSWLRTRSPDMESVLVTIFEEQPLILSSAVRNMTMSKNEIISLLMEVDNVAPREQRFKVKRRFLEVIEAGNMLGKFAIPIPYVPAPLPPSPMSPLQHNNILAMAGIRPLLTAFSESIVDARVLSPAAWWGKALLSAMSYGGLIKTSFLMALPDALNRAEPLMRWLELRLPTQNQNANTQIMRRWFPDPVSRMIFCSQRIHGFPELPILDRIASRQVYKLIRAYAREQGFDHYLPNGIKEIATGLKTRLHYHFPPWLVSYAHDDYPNTSLPDWSWQHVLKPPTSYVTTLTPRLVYPASSGPNPDNESDDNDDRHSNEVTEWPAQLKELATVIHGGHANLAGRIDAWRVTVIPDRLPSVSLIGEWVAEVLLKKGRGRRPKKRRTVYQMVNCIGGRLVGQLGRMDLTRLDTASSYVEIYQNALEDTPSILTRRKVAHSLNSLHDYLVKTYQVPPVSESGVFVVSGRGLGKVDANFIGLDTFFSALNWLRQEGKQKFSRKVVNQLELIGSLGYFCGLRRSEAIGLTLGDIEYAPGQSPLFDKNNPPDVWLEVSQNSLRSLKTRAGHRMLPLSLLMTPIELEKILHWHKTRRTEDPSPFAPLFPDFVVNGHAHDTDPRLDWITKSLQHIADDETLRFHHLRHSFASWLTLLLWHGEQNRDVSLPDWFLPTRHDQKRLQMSRIIRQGLIGKAPTNRRTLLQVSALMGHQGLDITLTSYIHLADFILGRMVHRLVPRLTDKQLSALSGYSVSNLYTLADGLNWKTASSAQWGQFLEKIADQMANEGKHKKAVTVKSAVNFYKPIAIKSTGNQLDRLLHCVQALEKALWSNTELQDISAQYGIDQSELLLWINRLSTLPSGILNIPTNHLRQSLDLKLEPAKRKLATKMLDRLTDLHNLGDPLIGKRAATQKQIQALIEEFPLIWIPGTYLTVKTASLPQAKRWLWFLTHLELADAATITHEKGTGKSVPSKSAQLGYWTKGLSNPTVIFSDSIPCPTNSATRGSVQINLNLQRTNNPLNPKKITVLYGIRFTLAILRVIGWR
jgi:integrase